MSRWILLLVAFGVSLLLSACEDEGCRNHSDCDSPKLCVEGSCWLALCDPEDPVCPEGTTCENGYCQEGQVDAGSDADS